MRASGRFYARDATCNTRQLHVDRSEFASRRARLSSTHPRKCTTRARPDGTVIMVFQCQTLPRLYILDTS